jgi:hypothetical protein
MLDVLAQRILRHMTDYPGRPMSRVEISAVICRRGTSAAALGRAIRSLLKLGLLAEERAPGRGRPATVYRLAGSGAPRMDSLDTLAARLIGVGLNRDRAGELYVGVVLDVGAAGPLAVALTRGEAVGLLGLLADVIAMLPPQPEPDF